jgi:hypothetical protein
VPTSAERGFVVNPRSATITAMTTHTQKITFGEMRKSGVRDVLLYCRDHRCRSPRRD